MELDWTRRRASQPFLMDWVNQLCAVLSLVCIADSRELYTCAACSFKSSLMYIPVWCHSLCAQNQLLMTAYRKELGLCQPGRTRKEKDKKNIFQNLSNTPLEWPGFICTQKPLDVSLRRAELSDFFLLWGGEWLSKLIFPQNIPV